MNILMLCDWLPPDFGAVGQYAVGFAEALAQEGHHVTLVGFTSGVARVEFASFGSGGNLLVRRVHRAPYDRTALLQRACWTIGANLALMRGAGAGWFRADEVRFTGSPPYLLHFVMPLSLLLRLRTRYRITDFHPECMMALLERPSLPLRVLSAVTAFWRRRVDVIEVLGNDQARRLRKSGVPPDRMLLRRDPSPVRFDQELAPAAAPPGCQGRLILYSGNWGVAHDHATFLEGYRRYTDAHPGRACLWLNATGARLAMVRQALDSASLPYVHTPPAPIERLPSVLVAADVHLITLDDRFVGYVMPSKVYACIASGRPVLFIGSADSDVHALCEASIPAPVYRRVATGDVDGVLEALRWLLDLPRDAAREDRVRA